MDPNSPDYERDSAIVAAVLQAINSSAEFTKSSAFWQQVASNLQANSNLSWGTSRIETVYKGIRARNPLVDLPSTDSFVRKAVRQAARRAEAAVAKDKRRSPGSSNGGSRKGSPTGGKKTDEQNLPIRER
ncbi:unnamed protein product [Zymoseptoria tritici ST99CH_3D1]|uniref:Uncharacterized protein n=2 Tax=Zymoseptoria tritici TaxID=1047171 RepID=A0A1X7S0V5_ZYMT9|nr:unnamed protein product [Zymoseptoria tritici ST99CH_3D7]SMR56839.1 unnamed protein product [Zymoseptoria tritici ST99CH_1E4]SMR59699.1 unnamed protein product [Zymoseptoria tritici ST99CH_3D1]